MRLVMLDAAELFDAAVILLYLVGVGGIWSAPQLIHPEVTAGQVFNAAVWGVHPKVSAGNDSLSGGAGNDKLTGGIGADRFDFNGLAELGLISSTTDTIAHFKTSEGDKSYLLDLDANDALAGLQKFNFVGTASTFTGDATGQLRFDAATHILYGSTDVDTAAEFVIVLTGVSSLASADLVL